MNDIRKYVQLIESQQPSIITASDDDNHYLFTYDAERLYESSGISWQLLLENRVQWLRDNIMYKLEPIASQEGKSTEELFDWIIEQDPSKKKQYSQWLMKILVGKNAQSTINDLKNAKEVLSKYEELKSSKKIKPEHKDLNRFKSITELKSAIYETEDGINKESEAIDSKARSESDILHEDETWIIVIPKTKYAAGYWGMNSVWCTATGFEGGRQEDRTQNLFDYYKKYGNIYTFVNKNDPSDIYQLSIPAKQFMDSEDEYIKYPLTKKLLGISPKVTEMVVDEIKEKIKTDNIKKIITSFDEIFGYVSPSDIGFSEDDFLGNLKDALWYAQVAVKGRFEQAEDLFATDAEYSYYYAKFALNGRFEQGEDVIGQHPLYSVKYAIYVTKGRFEKGEDAITQNAEYSYEYARLVLKGRFEKGEDTIAQDARYSYEYARDVIKGRFEKGEDAIAQDAEYSYYYATDVIKGRFERAEDLMRRELPVYDKPRYYELTGIQL